MCVKLLRAPRTLPRSHRVSSNVSERCRLLSSPSSATNVFAGFPRPIAGLRTFTLGQTNLFPLNRFSPLNQAAFGSAVRRKNRDLPTSEPVLTIGRRLLSKLFNGEISLEDPASRLGPRGPSAASRERGALILSAHFTGLKRAEIAKRAPSPDCDHFTDRDFDARLNRTRQTWPCHRARSGATNLAKPVGISAFSSCSRSSAVAYTDGPRRGQRPA